MMAGCHRGPLPPMRIGIDPWPGNAPLHLARHLGTLLENDFRLVEFAATSESSRSFRNGIIEATCSTLDDALRARQGEVDLVILLVLDESVGGDVLLARPEIRTLAQLKGRRVAVDVGSVSSFLLARALEGGGLVPADVTLVYLPVDRHVAAFRAAEVDAAATYEPARTRLLELGAIDLFNSTKIPGEIVDVVIVRRDYLEANPARGATLRRAWFDALAYLERSRPAALDVMASRLHYGRRELEAGLSGVRLADEATNRDLLGGPLPRLQASAEKMERMLRERGLLTEPVDVGSMFALPAALRLSR